MHPHASHPLITCSRLWTPPAASSQERDPRWGQVCDAARPRRGCAARPGLAGVCLCPPLMRTCLVLACCRWLRPAPRVPCAEACPPCTPASCTNPLPFPPTATRAVLPHRGRRGQEPRRGVQVRAGSVVVSSLTLSPPATALSKQGRPATGCSVSLGGRSNKLTPPPCTPLPLLRDALQELNTGVTVTSSAEDLSDDFLSRFQVRVRSSWAPVQASTPNPLAVLILPLPPPPLPQHKGGGAHRDPAGRGGAHQRALPQERHRADPGGCAGARGWVGAGGRS